MSERKNNNVKMTKNPQREITSNNNNNNSNSFIALEDNLLQEITAINDRIEDLINNQKPLLPPSNYHLSPFKNLPKKQEIQEHFQHPPYKTQIKNQEIPMEEHLPPEENYDRMKVFAQWLDLSVYERNTLWARNKTQRLENQKTAKKISSLQECTFKPKISQNGSGVSPEKYGTFDINQLKQIFRDTKKTSRNTYSNQRTLKKRYNSVNKPMNIPYS